jgi:hypothetical protein
LKEREESGLPNKMCLSNGESIAFQTLLKVEDRTEKESIAFLT